MFGRSILFLASALSCVADQNEILQKTLQSNTFGYISCPLDRDEVSWVKHFVQPDGNYTEVPIVSSTRDPSLQQPASAQATTQQPASTLASGMTVLWKNHLLHSCNNGSHNAMFNLTVIKKKPFNPSMISFAPAIVHIVTTAPPANCHVPTNQFPTGLDLNQIHKRCLNQSHGRKLHLK